MDKRILVGKSYFKMLELTFSSELGFCSYIISIAKTASKKIGALICSIKFFSRDCFVCLPCGHAWNSVVMSGVVVLVAT